MHNYLSIEDENWMNTSLKVCSTQCNTKSNTCHKRVKLEGYSTVSVDCGGMEEEEGT